MPKRIHIVQVILDALLITASLYVAYLLRFDFNIPPKHVSNFQITFTAFIFIKVLIYFLTGLYGRMWRYTGRRELSTIIASSTGSTLLVVFFIFYLQRMSYSRAVVLLDLVLTIFLLGGARFATRLIYEYRTKKLITPYSLKPLLIVGAGDAAEGVLRDVFKQKTSRYNPIGLLDDDEKKHGLKIHGIPVRGAIDDLSKTVARYDIEEVIIAIPSASRTRIGEIVNLCEAAGIKPKILPGINELISGDVSLNMLREVDIEDVLGREPVRVNLKDVSGYIMNRTILVSGAGGSIGSELCRQIAALEPRELIMVERSEENLFHIERELGSCSKCGVKALLTDIARRDKMKRIFEKYRPEVVFHAAAYKHVPMMEENPDEAIANNLFGTMNMVELSKENRVDKFILVSTDKAVNPRNIMGASKSLAEKMVMLNSLESGTKFIIVRFGNVLGSSGSVVPIFKEQIRKGGPVTVTSFEMTRYFMTIKEAVQLIIQAGAMGKGGEIFVLDMGDPVKILDLARNMILLSGLKPGTDIEITETGIRAGEKLHEELFSRDEKIKKTSHPKINMIKSYETDGEKLEKDISELGELLEQMDIQKLEARIRALFPDLGLKEL